MCVCSIEKYGRSERRVEGVGGWVWGGGGGVGGGESQIDGSNTLYFSSR